MALASLMLTDVLLLAWIPSPVELMICALSRNRMVEPNWTTAPAVDPAAGTLTDVEPRSSITPASNAWMAGPRFSLMTAPLTRMLPPENAKMPPLTPPAGGLRPLFEIVLSPGGAPNPGSPIRAEPARTITPLWALFLMLLPPTRLAAAWPTLMPKAPLSLISFPPMKAAEL